MTRMCCSKKKLFHNIANKFERIFLLLLEQLDLIQATLLLCIDTLMSNYESNCPTDIESIIVLDQKMCESELRLTFLFD